jgi:hypothetical protein
MAQSRQEYGRAQFDPWRARGHCCEGGKCFEAGASGDAVTHPNGVEAMRFGTLGQINNLVKIWRRLIHDHFSGGQQESELCVALGHFLLLVV